MRGEARAGPAGPYRLRYRLAGDRILWRAVLGVYARALLAF